MRPTSMIFLVLSLILIFGGFMTCSIAKSMAASENISIYDQVFDENGDAIYTYNISEQAINKLALTFSDVDVTVVGGASSSYVELKNFDVNAYSVSLNSANVTVDGTVNFASSLIDFSGGGIRFKGLRYFLLDKPDPTRPKSVTVYLSNTSDLKSLTVQLQKGTVTFKNVTNALDYNVTLHDANAVFDHVSTTSVASITAEGSNITMNASKFVTVSATLQNGNFSIAGGNALAYQLTSYDLTVLESGQIVYNGGIAGLEYKVTSPAPQTSFIISVTNGNIDVQDGGIPAIAPETMQPNNPAS